MADRVLRDHHDGKLCEHGKQFSHRIGISYKRWLSGVDVMCPGGREVTIDYLAAEEALQDWNPETTNAKSIVDAALGGSDG